jgi:hypothetical protein
MPQELGLPKYFDLKVTKPGTQLVFMGEYLGEVMGKFGAQHRFRQLKDNQEVVISGGQIDWRVENGHIRIGDVIDVTFEGKEKLAKGTYAGKETNNYKFAKYSRQELANFGYDLPEAMAPLPSGIEKPVAEPLGDLE